MMRKFFYPDGASAAVNRHVATALGRVNCDMKTPPARPPQTVSPPPRRMRYAEAAAYLGVTDRQIRRAVVTGQIGHSKLGLFVEFSQAQLDSYLSAHTYTPEP